MWIGLAYDVVMIIDWLGSVVSCEDWVGVRAVEWMWGCRVE